VGPPPWQGPASMGRLPACGRARAQTARTHAQKRWLNESQQLLTPHHHPFICWVASSVLQPCCSSPQLDTWYPWCASMLAALLVTSPCMHDPHLPSSPRAPAAPAPPPLPNSCAACTPASVAWTSPRTRRASFAATCWRASRCAPLSCWRSTGRGRMPDAASICGGALRGTHGGLEVGKPPKGHHPGPYSWGTLQAHSASGSARPCIARARTHRWWSTTPTSGWAWAGGWGWSLKSSRRRSFDELWALS